MQRLFDVGKVGCFVDGYGPAIEKRRSEEVKVVSVKFRVEPFDVKLAAALDAGVGEDSNIRSVVFTLNEGEPRAHFTGHDFKLALSRQNLNIFASPDTTDARIALQQAKISGTRVKAQKSTELALVFKATFGPVGRDELELIHSLVKSQAFITFEEAEPLLTDSDADAVVEVDIDTPPGPPTLEDGDVKPKTHENNTNRKLLSHAKGRKRKRVQAEA